MGGIIPNLGIFMKDRINKIRIVCKRFDQWGVYRENTVQTYTTVEGATTCLRQISDFGGRKVLDRVEIGNRKGWVSYDIDPAWDKERLIEALDTAMDMHVSFYDEGETE